MNLTFIYGIIFGMIAALLLNIGKGVQKQRVHIFLKGKKILALENRRDLIFWLCGLSMTASASIFYSIGLKLSKSPAVISSMTGIGLIGLFLFATFIIKEKVSKTDIIGILLVIISTSLLGYLGAGKLQINHKLQDILVIKTVIILVCMSVFSCLIALKIKKIHGITFGLNGGMYLGLGLFLADAALVKANGSILGQLTNPYPYFAFFFGMMATVCTQIGFLKSRALEVVPALNSSTILIPLLLEGIIYKVFPEAMSVILIMIIVIGVLLLSMGTASKISA